MSEKIRVYELAKTLGVSTREVLWALGQLKVDVKNHMSTIDPSLVDGVKVQLRIPVEKPPTAVEGKAEEEKEERGEKRAQPKPTPKRREEAAPAKAEVAPAPPARTEAAAPPARAESAPVPEPTVHEEEGGLVKEVVKPRKGRVKKEEERRDRRHSGRGWGRQGFEVLRQREKREIVIEGPITVGNLAQKLGVRPVEAIKRLMSLGVMAGINQEIEPQVASVVASDFGFRVEERFVAGDEENLLPGEDQEDESRLVPRWPVVTVMGHVDHGKTSLLDAIRETNVTAREAGGITQHIGASTVKVGDKHIVFVDTPGHEAFTAMRARGAMVTDLAVLVVAADDGVMPQTIEAINHARAARVPILVALNKIDKPNVNIDRVKQQLAEQGLVPEDWGGDTVCVPVSAREKRGIAELLEMILLVAEMRELKANPDRPARGVIIEAQLDKGRGPVATIIVQTGTLRVGDAFVAGQQWGKVRAMFGDKGRPLKEAGPSVPTEVLGFAGVPEAGDVLQVVTDERTAREISGRREERRRRQDLEVSQRLRLDQLFERMQRGEVKELNLVVKADVQGSLEAVTQAFERLENNEVRLHLIHGGVGGITESDVMLAAASGAIVIGFNVRPDSNARRAAEQEHVDIRTYRVIYEAIDDIKAAMQGLLEPKMEEVTIGRAEVRATFKVPKVGVVAGCYVSEGKVSKNAQVRVIRDGSVVFEGRVASLRRFKDDAREVAAGYECGIGLERFNDVREGDQLEFFAVQRVS